MFEKRETVWESKVPNEDGSEFSLYNSNYGVQISVGNAVYIGGYTFKDGNELRELANAINTYLYDKDHDGSND